MAVVGTLYMATLYCTPDNLRRTHNMPLKVALCVGYAGRFVWVGGSSESFRFLLLLPSSSRFTRAACCTIFLFIDRIVKRRHTMDGGRRRQDTGVEWAPFIT